MKEILDTVVSILMVGFVIFLVIGFFRQKQARDEERNDN